MQRFTLQINGSNAPELTTGATRTLGLPAEKCRTVTKIKQIINNDDRIINP